MNPQKNQNTQKRKQRSMKTIVHVYATCIYKTKTFACRCIDSAYIAKSSSFIDIVDKDKLFKMSVYGSTRGHSKKYTKKDPA